MNDKQIYELLESCYQTTVDRQLITERTLKIDFINKIKEEQKEMIDEYNKGTFNKMIVELADLATVCFNFARHYDIDLLKVIEAKNEINKTRI